MGQGQYDRASVPGREAVRQNVYMAASVTRGCYAVGTAAASAGQRPGGATVPTTLQGVDLHGWMTSDLASLRGKLFDGVVGLVPVQYWREQADGGGATLNGLLLHLARHHDLAVNAVIRDREPLFIAHRDALGLAGAPSGVGIAEAEDRSLSAAVDTAALARYLIDVFDTSAAWLDALGSLVLDSVPHSDYRLTTRAALDRDELPWLFAMWEGKPIWWLVQWPVIGHGHAHVGEATSIRNRLGFSPF